MRAVLVLHLARLRELGVAPEQLTAVEVELRRFGGRDLGERGGPDR